jgi:hypothetical protein
MIYPCKIRIIEPGWETYTGDLGATTFDNGVSTHVVNQTDAQRLANNIRVETLVGVNPSTSQLVIDIQNTPMDENMAADVFIDRGIVPDKTYLVIYTRAQLEEMADNYGIAGVRIVADPLGVKSKSIVALIEGVLQRQAELQGVLLVGEVSNAEATPVVIEPPKVAAVAAGIDSVEEAPDVESDVENIRE